MICLSLLGVNCHYLQNFHNNLFLTGNDSPRNMMINGIEGIRLIMGRKVGSMNEFKKKYIHIYIYIT